MSGNDKIGFDLGLLLKDLRLQKGINQDELANIVGYSIRQIQRFESDNPKMTRESIKILSEFYNVDLNNYIKLSDSFLNQDDYNKFFNLRKLIEYSEYDKMQIAYDTLKNDESFQDGEKLQLVLYCKAVLLSRVNNNYVESNELCYQALSIFNYDNYIEVLRRDLLTEISYPVLALIRYNLIKLDMEKSSNTLTTAMYKHFKDIVFGKPFPLKADMQKLQTYYIASIYNLSNMFYNHNKHISALITINKSIELSNQFGVLSFVPYLYRLKFKIYYMMDDIENSKKFFSTFKNMCEITNHLKYYDEVIVKTRIKYPLLFSK